MAAGSSCTFVIRWQQSEIDGVHGAPETALRNGAAWRWRGEAVRVDGPNHLVLRGDAKERHVLRRRASRTVERVLQMPQGRGGPDELDDGSHQTDDSFEITDGRQRYCGALLRRARELLIVFHEKLPVAGREHWVLERQGALPILQRANGAEGVTGFAPGTMIDTPLGPRAAESLGVGDLVNTRDSGPQPILWRGCRRMSGARLFAMPQQRPVRLRAGALAHPAATGRPTLDLMLAPQHRVLVRGPMAKALFNVDEVLVAAEDLVNDRNVLVDRALGETCYVDLMCERHEILMADGLECESFHPAGLPLATLEPDARQQLLTLMPELAGGADGYPGSVRRGLSRPEAAILRHGLGATA
jgi:hypothetical protein